MYTKVGFALVSLPLHCLEHSLGDLQNPLMILPPLFLVRNLHLLPGQHFHPPIPPQDPLVMVDLECSLAVVVSGLMAEEEEEEPPTEVRLTVLSSLHTPPPS